jgi:hypothetical protein
MSAVTAHPATIRSEPGARPAALGVAAICTSFAGLQIALAAGAPLGEHVWGGSQPAVLPGSMRIVAVGAAVFLGVMATVVTRRAGLFRRPTRWLTPATWSVAGYVALNTVGNLASSSDLERYVFGPATAVAAALTAVVARRSSREMRAAPHVFADWRARRESGFEKTRRSPSHRTSTSVQRVTVQRFFADTASTQIHVRNARTLRSR